MNDKHRGAGGEASTRWRSRPAVIAVVGWWSAIIIAIIGLVLVNMSMADSSRTSLRMAGIWLIGLAVASGLTGWIGSIGSLIKDRGRVRVGAGLLLIIPVVLLGFGLAATSSTVLYQDDPLPSAATVCVGILLFIGTMLIVLPEHLGTS